MIRSLCECGCGQAVTEGKQLRQGHYSRTPAAKKMYEKRRTFVPPPNPSGKCQCGCGQTTKKYTRSRASRGEAAGEHHCFLRGHGTTKMHRDKAREKDRRWKGGRFTNGYGYIEVLSPEHPHKNAKGYVLEHRLVIEKKLGRFLDPEERVHHINGIRTDNRFGNLIVLSRSDHSKFHVDALADWKEKDPERARRQSSEAGRKGAEARWGNRKK